MAAPARKVSRAKEHTAALRMLTFAYGQVATGWERLAAIEADEERAGAMRLKSQAAARQAADLELARDRAQAALARSRARQGF